MTKDEFIAAWEEPSLDAAQDALEIADEDDVTLVVAYRAIVLKLMEGLDQAAWAKFDGDEYHDMMYSSSEDLEMRPIIEKRGYTPLFALTLPDKEQ